MWLSYEIVLSIYLYHLKEHDRYACVISKYVSIIRRTGCVKNSTNMGHHPFTSLLLNWWSTDPRCMRCRFCSFNTKVLSFRFSLNVQSFLFPLGIFFFFCITYIHSLLMKVLQFKCLPYLSYCSSVWYYEMYLEVLEIEINFGRGPQS